MRHIITGLSCTVLSASCVDSPVMHKYESVNADGWHASDTVRIELPTQTKSTTAQATIELRTTDKYPYKNLSLQVMVMRNEINSAQTTLELEVYGNDGNPKGHGFPFTEHVLSPTFPIELTADSSYTLCIVHKMRTDPIAGISDIGVKITED